MRGDLVYVEDAWGKLLKRRVWEVGYASKTVYICNEERYQLLIRDEKSTLPPTGFPVENVFEYNESLDLSDPDISKKLKPYHQANL